MRAVALAALLAGTAAAQAPKRCETDADCSPVERCVTQKIACEVHHESSTCAARLCRRPVGGTIPDEDRACGKDSDCAVVVLEFRCMYCAREGDLNEGVVGAANKKRAKKYEVRATAEQTRSCATAEPCAVTGEMKARCEKKRCVAVYSPRGR